MNYDEPRCKVCYDNFMKSDLGKIFRLKYAGGKYAPFPRPPQLVDVVDKDTFRKLEIDRFPLFLGSQFGIHPKPEEYLDTDKTYIIAIYGKSLLSGRVSGLMLYRLRPGVAPGERNRIMTFNN